MASPYENELKRLETDARLARENARRIEGWERQAREATQRQHDASVAREQARHDKFIKDFYAPQQHTPPYSYVDRERQTSIETTGTGSGARSSGGGVVVGFAILLAAVLIVAGGKSGDSGAAVQSSLKGGFIPKYTPAPANAIFTTSNFLMRLEAKGCKRSDRYYDVCTGALGELRSGKYKILTCQYNGGMMRYAWSPEAPPNVNRYQDYDRNTIYGVDHVGAKDCGSLKDGFH